MSIALEAPANTVHAAFARQAKSTPQQTAIMDAGRETTYRQLDERAASIAVALMTCGVKSGHIVTIAMNRSVDMIASYLAVLQLGAAYCSLDLEDPPARRAIMLQDTKPVVLITADRLRSRLTDGAIPLLCVDDIPTQAAGWQEFEVDSSTDAPAAVMYTSGSTGQPKGALVPHRGILQLVLQSDYVPFGPGLRTLLHSPPHFDASTFEIWAPLLNGGMCAILPGARIPTLSEFAAAIRGSKVNCLFLGPALFNFIVDNDPQVLNGLEDVVIGGEVMSVKHIRAAMARFPTTRFTNGYGPTETTTFATTYKVPNDLPADARSVPIGKPIGQTQCHLLDENKRPVAPGETGELYIGGAGVTLGYINRPDLTAARFLPDAFSGDLKATMFRTGDLCRQMPDGNLEYAGRLDDQLKIRGHRIEPGEVEAQISAHPAVAQAVVKLHRTGDAVSLTGYYTVHTGAECLSQQMMQHLKQRLPPYLLPRFVMHLPQMPISPAGAIDLAALPQPVATVHGGDSSTPGSPFENQVLDIWRQVLNDSTAGPDGDFFMLGGTSLDAMRLCLLIEKTTGIFVPISMLLANSTAGTFAQAIAAHDPSVSDNVAVHLAGDGNLAPVFFIGGDEGHPLQLRLLAEKLSGRRLVYGLQLPGLDGVSKPLESVEATAAYLLPTVKRLAGNKPVNLLGYCYGGLIAYEMARMLRETSLVGSLLLIDAWTAASIIPKPWHQRLAARFHFRFRHLREKIDARFNAAPAADLSRVTLDVLIDRMRAVSMSAFTKHVPGRYNGKFISIRAKGGDPFDLMMSPGSGGWDHPAGDRVTTCFIPGNHSTMLRLPFVKELARHVDLQLSDG